MASINRVPVFIVGGGPVGLALAWCPADPKAELACAMTTLLAGTVADHPAMVWR